VLPRIVYFGFIVFKVASNLLGIPYYLARNPRGFARRARRWVDEIINLEINLLNPIEPIDLDALSRLMGRRESSLQLRFDSRYGNINLLESIALSHIVHAAEPRTVFEIGTFDGFSTYHLAKNSGKDTRIYTLNLPVEEGAAENFSPYSLIEYQGDSSTHAELRDRGLGSIYKTSDVAYKVTQLFGDSLTYDYTAFVGKVDLIFIDGGHSFRHVTTDTDNALRMVSDRGIIVWHDFNTQHRDIHRFLRHLGRGKKLYHIIDTRLVLYFHGGMRWVEKW
jgi:hypothetical protein